MGTKETKAMTKHKTGTREEWLAARSGCANGTLITSIRKSAELGSRSRLALTHPGDSCSDRTADDPEMYT